MSVGSMHAHTWYDRENPDVSIVILNLNKADLTAECLSHLWRHTAGRRYEIVVVDNGSSHDEFRKLAAVRGPMHLVRLDENRYFGEGNNIGFARSRGRFVVFLNNDAFVTQGWLAPLIDLLETRPDAGGVGPRFVYPDHRLQEAGAFVDDEAHAIQIGKFDIYDEADIGQERIVDYCSAACLAVRREIFEWVGGFDYMYEPAYYEDVDLCMKIAALGLFVYYCPQTTIVHIENATSRENRERLGLHNIVEINRRKFLSRWGQWLTDRANNRPAALPTQFAPAVRRPADGVAGGPKAVFYTPYNLIPGGGERYLLTAAVAAAARYDVYLATEHPYSDLRIASLGRDFAVDTSHIKTIARMDLPRLGAVEYSVIMSNELLPPFPGFGRRNLYVCQFPFPIGSDTFASRWGNLDAIDEVVVYSGFVEENVRRRLNEVNLGHKRIRVIHPPVNPIQVRAPSRSSEGPFKVILIGRFFAGGHNKRHDVAIEAVRRLVADNFPVELHLVGSLHSEPVHRAYYREL